MYSLNQTDKNFLYRKYTNLGCTPQEAYRNIKEVNDHLKFTMAKLRSKKLNEEELKNKFKQEFYKICQEIEGKF